MRKHILAAVLMLGLMSGAGLVGASEQSRLLVLDKMDMQTLQAGTLVVAYADEQDLSSIVDEGMVVDKKKPKKSSKKKAKAKKLKKSKKSAPGATEDGAGAGPTGQWDTGTHQ